MTFDPYRVRTALMSFDGDACRTADPRELAEYVRLIHADVARCYCPACVLARALLAAVEAAGSDGEPAPLAAEARARRDDRQTSHAAARSILPGKMRDTQQAVLDCFRAFGPMTDEALVDRYPAVHRQRGWRSQAPSGLRTRRDELVQAEYLRDSGRETVLLSGRRGTVWEINPDGPSVEPRDVPVETLF